MNEQRARLVEAFVIVAGALCIVVALALVDPRLGLLILGVLLLGSVIEGRR